MKFRCGKCGLIWRGEDHEDITYKDGHQCPTCQSEDIYGEE